MVVHLLATVADLGHKHNGTRTAAFTMVRESSRSGPEVVFGQQGGLVRNSPMKSGGVARSFAHPCREIIVLSKAPWRVVASLFLITFNALFPILTQIFPSASQSARNLSFTSFEYDLYKFLRPQTRLQIYPHIRLFYECLAARERILDLHSIVPQRHP